MSSNTQDVEHLRMLSIFHYVVAGLVALIACFPLIHFFFGVLLLSGGLAQQSDPGSGLVGGFLIVFAGLMILGGWAIAVCFFLAGRYLTERRNYWFCVVIAAIACIFMPVGTVLGVFTIIVLMRESVRQMFGVATAVETEG